MKNLISLIFLFICLQISAQQVKVEYLQVRSEIATLKEILYANQSRSISIQDSIVHFRMADDVSHTEKKTGFSPHFITTKGNNNSKMVQSVETIGGKNDIIYLINDEIKNLDWKINESSTKKLLGYQCLEAETIFRGREIKAFFAPEIKIDAGPFKFSGLPGLILEVYVKNLKHYRWKATSIDLNNKEKISFQPLYKNLNKIELKEFVALKDEETATRIKEIQSKSSGGYTSEFNKDRLSLEKTYEWEK